MRLRIRFLLLLPAFVAGCDFGATDSGNNGAGPTNTQLLELARSFTDDLESETGSLTITAPGAPARFDFVGDCPDSSSTTDADADGILDNATLTYAGAACRQNNWRDGVLAVTGEVQVTDNSQLNGLNYTLDFEDFGWGYTDPIESLSYISTRNGTRVRTGSTDSIKVETEETTDRQRLVITAIAHIARDLTWSFGATTPGSVVADAALPDGRLSVEGSWHWVRSTEDWELTVSTITPLLYDASCDEPQRFVAGTVRLSGTVADSDGHVTLTFSECGEEPTRTWVRD